MAKTTIERIESIKSRIQQLENEEKRLMQQQREAERKARTKRLIDRGAILESLLDDPASLTNDDVKAVLRAALNTEEARDTLMFVAKRHSTMRTQEPEHEHKKPLSAEVNMALAQEPVTWAGTVLPKVPGGEE